MTFTIVVNSSRTYFSLASIVLQHNYYKIASLTYNTLQTSQPSYIRQLLTIQLPGSTRSSSYLSLSRLSSLILFEVLQPLLCLRCTSSLERTPKRPPSVCTSSQP